MTTKRVQTDPPLVAKLCTVADDHNPIREEVPFGQKRVDVSIQTDYI